MALNGDFSRFVVMRTAQMQWTSSPSGSVRRKRLHHVGPEESGQVTSLVRFERGATFPMHAHPDGEEILVLDGVFSDESGDFPAGSYLLNPDGFHHAPHSRDGCLLFVKLRQYPGRERPARQLDTAAMPWEERAPGARGKGLFTDGGFPGSIWPDSTWLEEWEAGCTREFAAEGGGLELFFLDGEAESREGRLAAGDWVRFPADQPVEITAHAPCAVYVKQGFYELLTNS